MDVFSKEINTYRNVKQLLLRKTDFQESKFLRKKIEQML